MTDPWAPPPEGWTPPPGWAPPPGAPGWSAWPGLTERPRRWRGPVLRAGLALVAAATLSGATIWAALRAALTRSIEDALPDYAYVVEGRTFLQEHHGLVTFVVLLLLTSVAWGLFGLAHRAAAVSADVLIPYVVLGLLLGVVGGYVVADLALDLVQDLAFAEYAS